MVFVGGDEIGDDGGGAEQGAGVFEVGLGDGDGGVAEVEADLANGGCRCSRR